ncbi:hypothetical protein GCM10010975_03720 [Comamonas phosphati]|nr:hypothetical protein GCM10010975_03720 [Comamonas phosphati]
MHQRRKFSANGETRSWARRPTMALPAHSKGAMVSMAAVDGFKEEFIGTTLYCVSMVTEGRWCDAAQNRP